MNRRLFLASLFGTVAARALPAPRELRMVSMDFVNRVVTFGYGPVLISRAQAKNRIDFISVDPGAGGIIENLTLPSAFLNRAERH